MGSKSCFQKFDKIYTFVIVKSCKVVSISTNFIHLSSFIPKCPKCPITPPPPKKKVDGKEGKIPSTLGLINKSQDGIDKQTLHKRLMSIKKCLIVVV